MKWTVVGTATWFVLMGMLGSGCMLLLLRKRDEMEQKGTVLVLIRTVLKRTAAEVKLMMKMRARLKEQVQKVKQKYIDLEIYDSMLLLKNLALAEKEQAFSADYFYETLMQHAGHLKPVYAQMLTLYRGGKDRDAFQYLTSQCGSRAARNFSMVLSKVDRIQPDALAEQMDVFLEIMSQQRVTAEMRKVQRNSIITTMSAVAAAFVMVIDFAVTVVFMHTMTLMEQAF